MRQNKPEPSYFLPLAGFGLILATLIFVFALSLSLLCQLARAEEPPKVPPYQIPTFDGKARDFREPIPPIAPAPEVDGDVIFQMVVNCFPERVKWGIEIDAVAGSRWQDRSGISAFDTSGLARHYVGIVARMPLYSATEINRERQEEYRRRQEVAENIQKLLLGLSNRRRAQRELGLYTSLEARAQKRVAMGLVEASEQISYLEKVAQAQAALDAATAQIEGARLALVGQCRDEVAEEVNRYLKEVTQ
ncbi:MAG: hypothetical protein N3A55_10960 [Methylohalobius sp.]|nr:hypothetical protein [Methylohalobius sp.]